MLAYKQEPHQQDNRQNEGLEEEEAIEKGSPHPTHLRLNVHCPAAEHASIYYITQVSSLLPKDNPKNPALPDRLPVNHLHGKPKRKS